MKQILAGLAFLVAADTAESAGCTLVQELGAREWTYRSGTLCETRFSPASTFKVPLALMGFESGLLRGPTAPLVPYDPKIKAHFKSWRTDTNPQTWLRNSVIWYSQWLTSELGMAQFQSYVDAFDFGNRDLSGDPGQGNGLTRAWLSSSLKISPEEQIAFWQKLWLGHLPVGEESVAKLEASLTRFEPVQAGSEILAKTGNAWAVDGQGHRLQVQIGWFVGRARFEGKDYVFVHLRREDRAMKGFASGRARREALDEIGGWIGATQ